MKYSKKELTEKALKVFETHPECCVLLATTDGQFFKSDKRLAADRHARQRSLTVIEILNPDAFASSDELSLVEGKISGKVEPEGDPIDVNDAVAEPLKPEQNAIGEAEKEEPTETVLEQAATGEAEKEEPTETASEKTATGEVSNEKPAATKTTRASKTKITK